MSISNQICTNIHFSGFMVQVRAVLPVVLSVIPWLPPVARHSASQRGDCVTPAATGPMAFLAAAPLAGMEVGQPDLIRAVPHVIAVLRMCCPEELLRLDFTLADLRNSNGQSVSPSQGFWISELLRLHKPDHHFQSYQSNQCMCPRCSHQACFVYSYADAIPG